MMWTAGFDGDGWAVCQAICAQLKVGRRVLLIRSCAEEATLLRRYREVVVNEADGALATNKAGLGCAGPKCLHEAENATTVSVVKVT